MAVRGVTTAKPETQVKAIMQQYINRYHDETGQRIPAPRRSHTFTDGDTTVTVRGESLGYGPMVEYRGPQGLWYASINKWVGTPWRSA